MSIEVRAYAKDPAVLAELIANTMQDGVVVGREPMVANLSALVAQEEREVARRRDAWRWLNTIASPKIDRDNDWSDV
jgi:hypothetical protein